MRASSGSCQYVDGLLQRTGGVVAIAITYDSINNDAISDRTYSNIRFFVIVAKYFDLWGVDM